MSISRKSLGGDQRPSCWRRIAIVAGFKEQLIGLNYQATAYQFGLFRRGVFSNAECTSAQRKQRAHRCRKFGRAGKTISRFCSRMHGISTDGPFAWEAQSVSGNGPHLASNGTPLGKKGCRGDRPSWGQVAYKRWDFAIITCGTPLLRQTRTMRSESYSDVIHNRHGMTVPIDSHA